MPKALQSSRQTWGEMGRGQGQLQGHRDCTGSPVPVLEAS